MVATGFVGKYGGAVDFDIALSPPGWVMAADFATLGLDIRSHREPLKRAVQGVLAGSFRYNFDVGGRPGWEPLAESTVQIKHDLGYPPDILVRTGKLKRVAGQLNIWTITREEAYVTQLPGAEYGEFHQSGTKHMPAREFMVIQPSDEVEIEQVFETWLLQRFGRRGFIR